MLDSRPSLRSVAPQVIAPQPVLALSWGPSDAGPGPATDMSCGPSASSDHTMADASPAVLDSVPVFLCFWF